MIYICKICGKEVLGIGLHVYRNHNINSKEYYDQYIKKDHDGSYWHQDNQRQDWLEKIGGWEFLRYVDYVPTKDQLIKDMNQLLFRR